MNRNPPSPTVASTLDPSATLLAHPAVVVPARHFRSTLLLGSIASLRDAGRFDDYVARLPPAHRDALVNAVAGTWIPIETAFSHYATCDTLGFSVDQQLGNGRSTFDKTQGTITGTVTRMARETGVTPWNVLSHYQRFWDRSFDGGAVSVVKVGPKEAVVEFVGCRLADSAYYRNAVRGLLTAVTELFCRKAYMTEKAMRRVPASFGYRVQWA
jgi:hypothetical protein